jgi:hypothetical protein
MGTTSQTNSCNKQVSVNNLLIATPQQASLQNYDSKSLQTQNNTISQKLETFTI